MTSLDLTAESMWEELEASRLKIEGMFSELDPMIQRYHTFTFDPRSKAKREVSNPAFEILSTMQSQICAGDPSFVLDPQRSDDPTSPERAIGLQFAVNRTVRNMKLKRTLQRALVDFFFRRAALVTERTVQLYSDRGPLDGPPYRPNVRNVGMRDLRYDARTKDMRERRWTSHRSIISRGSLLDRIKRDPEEKGWYTDVIAGLTVEANLSELVAKDGETLSRDDFVLWSVWTPDEQVGDEYTPDKGYWGSWRFYAQTGIGKNVKSRGKTGDKKAPLVEIREPQPCFTARTGPYTIIGQYDVPDEAEPLSLMVATESASRELGSATKTIIRAIRDYKRLTIYGGPDPALGRKIKTTDHGGFFHSNGFDPTKAFQSISGGVDEPTMAAYRFLVEQFNKVSGMTEAMMGQTATGATATADTLAAGGAAARVALMRNAFYDGVGDIGAGIAELIDGDDRFFMRVPQSVQQQTGLQVAMIRGGRDEGQTFEDYDVRLMPMFMRYRSEDEIAQSAEAEWMFWQSFAAMAPSAPYLNMRDIIRDRAMQTERPMLDSRVNYEMLEEVSALMLQGQIQTQSVGSQTSTPTAKPQSMADAGARPRLQSVGGPAQSRSSPMRRGPGSGPATPTKGNTIGDKAGRTASKAVAKVGKVA